MSESISSPISSATSISTPRRGGTHPIFGIYVGGGALDTAYKLKDGSCYSCTSQLRNEKQLNVAETSLYEQRNNTTTLKFNGNMDVQEPNTASLSELNLEQFLRNVGDAVEMFGLETILHS